MSTILQRSRRVDAAFKALMHQERGAGKSRVLRKFFGLSQADEAFVEEEIGQALDVNLRRDEGNAR